MDTVPSLPADHDLLAEARVWTAHEAALIAEADLELEAGLYVDADEMRAWIKSMGTDHELPPPPTRQR